MERSILRVGRTSEGLQSGCSGRPWAPPPPQTWPPKRSRGAREVARAHPAVRAAALRSFEPWERREWGVEELLLRCLVSTRASYTQTDSWQSTTTYNEKCSQFVEELSELAYLRQWDNVRALLVKVSRNIDAYLDEDENAAGSDQSFKTYAVRSGSGLEDLLRDVESLNIPKPLLVMFARKLVLGGGQGKGGRGGATKAHADVHLVHSLQIMRWLATSTIHRQREMVMGPKDYTKIINQLLRKSKTLNSKEINPYKQRAYEAWITMQTAHGDKLDAAAVRSGMNACAMTERTEEALEIFQAHGPIRSEPGPREDSLPVCFNILIKGFGLEKNLERLDEVIDMMKRCKVRPTESTYNTLVNAYVNLNRLDRAWRVVQEAIHGKGAEVVGEESQQYLYATILKGLVRNIQPKLSGMHRALYLMNQMKTLGVDPDVYVYSQLMDHLIKKENDVDAADRLFQQMQQESFGGVKPNVVVYNILLRGYCNQQSGLSKNGVGWSKSRCLELLKDMGKRGIKPNTSTFNTLISAAVSNDDQRSASKLFKLMVDLNVDPDRMTFTTVMKSFSDQRRPEEVKRLFHQLDASPLGGADKIAFNCLIGAYGKAEQLEEAEEVYKAMISRKIEPDSVTFNSMVRASCAAKDPKRAAAFIRKSCALGISIAPSLFEASIKSMVAAGEFGEAKAVLKAMRQAGAEDVDVALAFVEEQQQAFAQKEQNVAVERVKFWVGLPNKYYSDAEDWRDT